MTAKVKQEDIIKMRGVVAHNFTTVEIGISVFISKYYFRARNWDFIHTVLYDELITFGLKLRIFEKLLRRGSKKGKEIDDIFKNLQKENRIRNTFAHRWAIASGPNADDHVFIGPKGMEDKIDPEKLYNESLEVHKLNVKFLQALDDNPDDIKME